MTPSIRQEMSVPRSFKPHIPKTMGELMDQLGFMILKAPTFEDIVFPGRNVETVFFELTEGLKALRTKLGEERFLTLMALSKSARAEFEADREDSNGRAREGRKLIYEMRSLLEK